MKNIAIIFAGGSGARMGSGLPKQFIEVDGKPIIIHTMEIFEEHSQVDAIYVACKEDYIPRLEKLVRRFMLSKVKKIVPGGTTGQDSILHALQAAKAGEGEDNIVMIHDGVRPCITSEVIDANLRSVQEYGSAITCTKFFETPIVSHGGSVVEESLDRSSFYTAQAPQSFILSDVLAAHEQIRRDNPTYEGIIDTCTLMRAIGREVYLVEGNRGNIKVTTPEDLYVFRAMLEYRETQEALGLSQKDISEYLKK